MKKLVLLLGAILMLGAFYIQSTTPNEAGAGLFVPAPSPSDSEILRVCSWNIQIFGDSKVNDGHLPAIESALSQCDIAIVQEIRDIDGSSWEQLCAEMPEYQCAISERKGRSSSKEQYGLLYRNAVLLDVTESVDYVKWERPPTIFRMNTTTPLNLITLHAKPDDAENELYYLEDFAEGIEESTILLGDFNQDCSYFDEDKPIFEEYYEVIGNEEDTTVGTSDCTYDRIYLGNVSVLSSGVYKNVTVEVSDHYLVWADISAS